MIDNALSLDCNFSAQDNYPTCSFSEYPLGIIKQTYFHAVQWGYALMLSDGWEHRRLIDNPISC